MKIGEYCRGEYPPLFTEPEANNCFSIIFRGETKKNIHVCSRSFNNTADGKRQILPLIFILFL